MNKIFNFKIERFDQLSIDELIEISEKGFKQEKTDAIICLGNRIDEDKEKIMNHFKVLLEDDVNFIPQSLNPTVNFLIIILLIENTDEHEFIHSEFEKWDETYRDELKNYLKDFPEHLEILENTP